ncbi:uncharacterized protein BT62DRAFT_488780 [Guyanagaster necrorhizus]|uniref:Uncharacterized protein n=1 Tax=Guyanagaster necrorhizus TaxID=856835 RepID=A0A9P8AN45_9AGAR|nr:uncharacterized protein BT62DRAFT_488780 [Guyanagaster necrorhizus MCA 3950]KAG7441439.1 hypothetical protein BT62DRAFT_488780 [Guyanagaster necrorhizus MCA 3950]
MKRFMHYGYTETTECDKGQDRSEDFSLLVYRPSFPPIYLVFIFEVYRPSSIYMPLFNREHGEGVVEVLPPSYCARHPRGHYCSFRLLKNQLSHDWTHSSGDTILVLLYYATRALRFVDVSGAVGFYIEGFRNVNAHHKLGLCSTHLCMRFSS